MTRDSVEAIEAIKRRKSIRGFKPEPVSRETLAGLLALATRAPSTRNAQPWEITVITGCPLDRIRDENIESLYSGSPVNPDINLKRYTGKYRERQNELARRLFTLLGIGPDDKTEREVWRLKTYRFFDAPAAIILGMDSSLDDSCRFDLGCLAQSICLAAFEFDLGTCIEDAGIAFPEVIRKHTAILESTRIIKGIAVGYPDRDFPANRLETPREPIESVTGWCGFE